MKEMSQSYHSRLQKVWTQHYSAKNGATEKAGLESVFFPAPLFDPSLSGPVV